MSKGSPMKTKLAVALSLLLSTSAMAHQEHTEHQQSCNINIEKSVKVTPSFIQVLDGDESLYRIEDGSTLYTQGKRVHLTDEQQALVEEYSALIQELAPQVAQIIADALEIAQSAISGVITELFGQDTELQNKVESIIVKMKDKAAPMVNQAKGEYFLAKDSIESAGDDFGKEIEQEVENLLKESSGHLLMLVGKMLVDGEEGMDGLEEKMQAFGDQMEQRGNELEARAEAMCEQAVRLDELESRMQKEIPQFAQYDLISQGHI